MSAILIRIVVPISFVLLLVSVTEAGILHHKVHVEAINWLLDSKDLTLHCYERKGEDLGEHTIHPNEKYTFVFRPRFIGKSSKYYCSFKWDGSNLKWFDLYSQGRDYKDCRNCSWVVKSMEICRLDYKYGGSVGAYTLCFPF
ncbi:unnamed protein product [Lathyrus oleraceus]